MNIQLIKKAQQETIVKRNRANKITFIAGTFCLVYGLTFAFIMPGIEAIILGSFITVFGVFIFSFSVAAKQNNK
jgi:hypothetical protein